VIDGQNYVATYNTVVLSVFEMVTVTEFHINITKYFYYDKTEKILKTKPPWPPSLVGEVSVNFCR
jgi:hypothetical protein